MSDKHSWGIEDRLVHDDIGLAAEEALDWLDEHPDASSVDLLQAELPSVAHLRVRGMAGALWGIVIEMVREDQRLCWEGGGPDLARLDSDGLDTLTATLTALIESRIDLSEAAYPYTGRSVTVRRGDPLEDVVRRIAEAEAKS